MTPEQKAAMEYFRRLRGYATPNDQRHYDMMEAMLAEPRMPADPTAETIATMEAGWFINGWRGVYRSLWDHLANSKIKTVWHITAIGRSTAPYVAHSRVCDAGRVGPEMERLKIDGYASFSVTPMRERT